MKKRITVMILVACMVFSMLACAQPTPAPTTQAPPSQPAGDAKPPEPAANPAPAKKLRIGLVVQSLSNFFHVEQQQAALAAGEEFGVDVVVLASANLEEQLKVMEDLIQTKPDAIAVDCFDKEGIIPAVEKALEMGIPTFAVDNRIPGANVLSFIGTDNIAGGEAAAEWIVARCGEDAVVGLVQGVPGAYATNAREEGLNNVLNSKYKNVKVCASITANLKRDQALNVANDIMTANPDLDVLFALNDEMALGVAQAIVAADKQDTVAVIGFNGVPEAIKAVYDGLMTATVVQFPEIFSRTFIQYAIDYLENGVQPPTEYLVPAFVVDTELARAIVDDGLKPTSDFEEVLYAKIIKFVKES